MGKTARLPRTSGGPTVCSASRGMPGVATASLRVTATEPDPLSGPTLRRLQWVPANKRPAERAIDHKAGRLSTRVHLDAMRHLLIGMAAVVRARSGKDLVGRRSCGQRGGEEAEDVARIAPE